MLHENGIRFHGFHTSRAAGQKDGQINRERNFWEFGRSWIYYHAHFQASLFELRPDKPLELTETAENIFLSPQAAVNPDLCDL
jgi:hypothetical protein